MNHCVPDFEIQMDVDEYSIPSSSGSGVPRSKKPSMPEEDIMELLWQNGQVVMQSQNQRPLRKTLPDRYADGVIPSRPSTAREIRPSQQEQNYHNQHLFMQEDEMTSWLHYPIVDDPPLDHNFCTDILCTPSPPPPPPPHLTVNNSSRNNNSTMQNLVRTNQVTELRQPSRSVAPRPPIPPPRKPEQVHTMIPNLLHFSNHNARVEPAGLSCLKTAAKESTVVESCDTPAVVVSASRVSDTIRNSEEPTEGDAARRTVSTAGFAETFAGGETAGREATTCEMTTTSSPGGSSGSDEPARRPPAEDRKRKGREAEDSECHSEDVDFESEAKRQICWSTSTKRSRAAEVHNLSERRRRDRINEKMRALQELIPRCNKSDKASMLDEAIEYLKSLQLQVQMMSMGCGMVPMMFPGIQQYMPAMGMGIGMGMGMGMDMGMNRPLMPFPNMLAASALPATASAAAATAHLGPRFPMPPFPDSSRMPPPPPNQSDNSMLSSLLIPDPNQSRIPNFTDPYHQYFSPHQMHLQFMQNQAMHNPNVSKPNASKSHENTENNQSGA